MMKQVILCDWCEATLKHPDKYITIDGKIHYCNEVCQNAAQNACEEMTYHRNSVKDQVQGNCLDCGKRYEISGL